MASINEANQSEITIDEITTGVEILEQEHLFILSKGGDSADNMNLVADTLPSGAYLTSIKRSMEQVTLGGKADSPFTVISYAMALEASGQFSEVRIAEIGMSKGTGVETTELETMGVSFRIAVRQ